MNNVVIRNATAKDIDFIMTIEKMCFDEDTVESEAIYLERINLFSDGFLILEVNSTFVGFISSELWIHNDTITKEMFLVGHSIADRHKNKGNELYISSLAISPNFQGNGYGELLFNSLLSKVCASYPSIQHLILLVGSTWTNALKIYTKYDMKKIETYNDFFGGYKVNPYNGLILYKQL
jgi:ribosomal-protein-alanine N-acetyltransferase